MAQVIWSIDPFEADLKPSPEFIHHLKEWMRQARLELQPVYVYSAPREEQQSFEVASHRAFLEESVAKFLAEFDFQDVRPVQILFDGEASWKNATKKLIEFAERQDAVCIMVGSHGRAGVKRLLFGSFAESLLSASTIPVFFLTHQRDGTRPQAFGRILFATDFSEVSHRAYKQFVAGARRFGFDIILYSSISFPAVAALGTGFSANVPDTYFSDQEQWAKNQADLWMREAEDHGVTVRLALKNNGFDNETARHILQAAQEYDVGLIAMASFSRTVEAAVAGSVARDVCRANQVPLWAYGPAALEALKEELGGLRPGSIAETHLDV